MTGEDCRPVRVRLVDGSEKAHPNSGICAEPATKYIELNFRRQSKPLRYTRYGGWGVEALHFATQA